MIGKRIKTVLRYLVSLWLFLGAAGCLSLAVGGILIDCWYTANSWDPAVLGAVGLLLAIAAIWVSRRWFAPEYSWPVIAAGLALAMFTGRLAGVVFALLCLLDSGQSSRLLAAAWVIGIVLWAGWTAVWYHFYSRRKQL